MLAVLRVGRVDRDDVDLGAREQRRVVARVEELRRRLARRCDLRLLEIAARHRARMSDAPEREQQRAALVQAEDTDALRARVLLRVRERIRAGDVLEEGHGGALVGPAAD